MFGENQASQEVQAVPLARWPGVDSQAVTMAQRAQIGTEELNRLRWQCRRGMLELDVVLERFLDRFGDLLQGDSLSAFQALLARTDVELWDLIRARTECRDAALAEVVQWMRDCRDPAGSQGSTSGARR